jgi:hypothetical protein
MTILTFTRYERYITLGLLPLLLLLFLQVPAVGADVPAPEGETSNVTWTTRGDIIVINYDLEGEPESRFEVLITMKRENDSAFAIVPRTIEGHIGEGVSAGEKREAQWYYRRDYPLGFSGKGYYFEIEVKKMEVRSNMLYYLVGGAAIVGGIIAIIASQNQPSGPPPPGDLPYPPVRP